MQPDISPGGSCTRFDVKKEFLQYRMSRFFRYARTVVNIIRNRPLARCALVASAVCFPLTFNPAYAESADRKLADVRSTAYGLSKNFVADAVAIASPSVVNIRCSVGGVFGGESAGSGFIISKVTFPLVTLGYLIIACRTDMSLQMLT